MIDIIEREMTDAEFARRCAGADEYTIEHGIPIQTSEQFGFVALDGAKFIGCATAVAYKNGSAFGNWAYLSELFIEKPYRGQGLGAVILRKLEKLVAGLGISNMRTQTKYEAEDFYKKQGYQVCFEMRNYYPNGYSHVGLRKALNYKDVPCSYMHLDACSRNTVRLVERRMTDAEFARMNAGFDEHDFEHGCPVTKSERHSSVALDAGAFIGCISGLFYNSGPANDNWFVLTDLFLEKAYRRQGYGTDLLRSIEKQAAALGVKNVATWVAGYEAPGFFQKHGYEVFCEYENWYHAGYSRIGLQKTI